MKFDPVHIWSGSVDYKEPIKPNVIFNLVVLITYKQQYKSKHFIYLIGWPFSILHTASPTIISSKSNITIQEQQTAKLPCIAEGSPFPKINWTRNDVIVGTGSPLRLNVTFKNHGECYTCIAYNGIPPDKSVILCLDVHCEYSILY